MGKYDWCPSVFGPALASPPPRFLTPTLQIAPQVFKPFCIPEPYKDIIHFCRQGLANFSNWKKHDLQNRYENKLIHQSSYIFVLKVNQTFVIEKTQRTWFAKQIWKKNWSINHPVSFIYFCPQGQSNFRNWKNTKNMICKTDMKMILKG